MWQQAKGRAISSSGLRVDAFARDWARRSVARFISVGGRVEAVGIMRLRVRVIVEAVEEAIWVVYSLGDGLDWSVRLLWRFMLLMLFTIGSEGRRFRS